MKLHFDKDDSIYKIFKTLRKIPSYRSVKIFIDPKHDFFATQRRGQEAIDTLEKKGVEATFIVNDIHSKRYFEDIGAQVTFKQANPIYEFGRQVYNLLFATKEFHNNLIVKQNYVSYLVLLAELVVIGGVLYMFRGMISPNASINIKPAYTIESIVYNYRYYPASIPLQQAEDSFISIPYHTGSIPFDHDMTMNVANIKYHTTEAKGQIKITNTLPETISLIGNTRLVTETGIIYVTDTRLSIPSAVGEIPGEVTVGVTALKEKENLEPIGAEGNIEKGTLLYIRNIPDSIKEKKIYAEALENFKGGKTQAIGTVDSKDIATIRSKITDYMYEKRKEQLQENFNKPDTHILLFDDLIKLNIKNFETTALAGQQASLIEGKVKATVDFLYIYRNDINTAIATYLRQRPSENLSLYDIDKNSLTFYDYNFIENGQYYLIPTRLNAIRGYNFSQDGNKLVEEVKEKITGLSKSQAEKELLDYEEIAEADINISPPRYDSLPQVKSRIKIKTPLDRK